MRGERERLHLPGLQQIVLLHRQRRHGRGEGEAGYAGHERDRLAVAR